MRSTPKDMAICSNSVKPKQPLVRIEIERAKASPEQLAAWRRLWAKLLAAPTSTAAVGRPEEGKASIRQSNETGCQENGNDHT
jgi:hypothetical protein